MSKNLSFGLYKIKKYFLYSSAVNSCHVIKETFFAREKKSKLIQYTSVFWNDILRYFFLKKINKL